MGAVPSREGQAEDRARVGIVCDQYFFAAAGEDDVAGMPEEGGADEIRAPGREVDASKPRQARGRRRGRRKQRGRSAWLGDVPDRLCELVDDVAEGPAGEIDAHEGSVDGNDGGPSACLDRDLRWLPQ